MMRALAAGLGLLCLVACTYPARPGASSDAFASDGSFAMGTVLEVSLVARDEHEARARIESAFGRARELEALLSSHDPESQVSRVSRDAGGGWHVVDPRVSRLVTRSIEFAALSRGSFDVTVGPLLALWTRSAERDRLPSSSEIEESRTRVGSDQIQVSEGALRLGRVGMSLDLGGIAKGYALDEIVGELRAAGIRSALLSFGQSSGWALGGAPGEAAWRLLVRAPGGGFAGSVELRDRAYSVSSSMGQGWEIEGQRVGHIVDPRSGRPVAEAWEAVVIAASATLAEALSTALVVLGADRGLEIVAGLPDCEALMVDARGELFESPGWRAVSGFSPTY